jgi:hypothetical protein
MYVLAKKEILPISIQYVHAHSMAARDTSQTTAQSPLLGD